MDQNPLTMNQVIEEIEVYLNATEMNYEVIQKNSNRIYRRTTRIIKTVFILIGLMLLINTYYIYDFGEGIVLMVSSMNEMYVHFANMGNQMQGITQAVEKMTSHVEVLPSMAESMNSMNQTVVEMNSNVQLMQGEVNYMAKDVDSINNNMTDMSYQFDELNYNMYNIGDSVHEISRTIPKN